ncbi:fungal-specific transcription factor domain-containing protein [Cercophora scortea]|uniref:Fungal-specific transcription factor domain-containing protein n=1 Tax=Cercophora scortea TaxID=314031 RepID=A0AAE0I8P0_9PEZI|nr:fungal-specific transcription factor domain-containing protein [Cercophora scortea]
MPPKRKEAAEVGGPSPADTSFDPLSSAVPAPVKRQRVSRACDQCRAAREKCDGIRPQCYPCVTQHRPCTYTASPKKRGVQTGYIRTLELALAWVFENSPGSEDALSAVLTQGGQMHNLLGGKDPGGAERVHRKWRRSRVSKSIDLILAGGIAPSSYRDKLSPLEDASDTEGEAHASTTPRLISRDQGAPGPDPSGGIDIPRKAPRDPPRSSADSLPPVELPPSSPPSSTFVTSASPARLKLPANHWRLLDIYFSYTHSWLPILDKQDLFQALYQYAEQGLVVSPGEALPPVHAELWSVLALAAFQDRASSKISPTLDYDHSQRSPAELYDIARDLIPFEDGKFHVQHARALLLLSLVNLGRGHHTSAWLLVGLATRISLDTTTRQSLGHGPSRHNNGMQPVLAACFMLDTIISVRYNKPAHLAAEDVADEMPIPEDGLEQWEPWISCEGFGTGHGGSHESRNPAYCLSTFNQLFGLLRVVSREMVSRRRGPPSAERTMLSVSELQEAVRPNSPFAIFVKSPPVGSASVPTAYLVRILFLWAVAFLGPQADASLAPIRDTLVQYRERFGACGMPTFISSCLHSLRNQPDLPDHCKAELDDLLTVYSSPWGEERRMPNTSYPVARISQTAKGPPGFTRPSLLLPPMNLATTFPTPAPFRVYNNSTIPTSISHGDSGGYGFLNNSSSMSGYQRTALLPTTQSHRRAMEMQSSLSGIGPSQRNHHHSAPYTTTGFGGHSVEFEALLDDLASIECTDPVEVDPQFMMNLGFAPGCDIDDILSRGFGGI